MPSLFRRCSSLPVLCLAWSCGARSLLDDASLESAPDARFDTMGGGATGNEAGTADSSRSGGDGAASDAEPDVTSDAGVILETIDVKDMSGSPVPDVDVLVSYLDGAVSGMFMTDASGRVVVDVPSGGSVSLLRVRTSESTVSQSVSTVYAIPEGQTILFLLTSTNSTPALPEPMAVSIVVSSAPVGTTRYFFALPCWSTREESFGRLDVDGFTGCAGSNEFDVYVLALDASGVAQGYAAVLDLAFVPGGTLTVHADATRTDFDEQRVRIGKNPDKTESLHYFVMAYRDGAFARTAREALRFELVRQAPKAEETFSVRLPKGLFTHYKSGGRIELGDGTTRIMAGFDRFGGQFPRSFVWNPLALAMLERVEELQEARPALSYNLAERGELGDVVRLNTSWSRTGATTSFTVTAPPERSATLQLPEMPPGFEGFMRLSDDENGTLSGSHMDDHDRDGYAGYLLERVIGDASSVDVSSLFR